MSGWYPCRIGSHGRHENTLAVALPDRSTFAGPHNIRSGAACVPFRAAGRDHPLVDHLPLVACMGMNAQPVHEPDPDDPVEILRVLPAWFHDQFLREYYGPPAGAARPVGSS